MEYILRTLDPLGTNFEFEYYETSHSYNLKYFLEYGLMKPPLFIQTVFDLMGGISAHPEDVMHMKRSADRLFGNLNRWSVAGAGKNQLTISAIAAAMGRKVRVGLDDLLWVGPGQLAKSNAELAMKAPRIVEGLGSELAKPYEAREILELKETDKVGF